MITPPSDEINLELRCERYNLATSQVRLGEMAC